MNKFIIIIFAALLFTTAIYATDEWPSGTQTGTFAAAIYCTPTFGIEFPPGTPIYIGSYFTAPFEQVFPINADDLPNGNKLYWKLLGPQKLYNGSWINYNIEQVQPNNTIDNGVSIVVKWQIISENYNYNNFTGQLDFPDLNLQDRTSGGTECGDGEAFFRIRAIEITLNPNAVPGVRKFKTSLVVTVNI